MRFAMIFEGIDRATKVMNKVMAAEKKTAAAVKAGSKATQSAADKATKATQKQTSALGKLGSVARGVYNGVASGARRAYTAVVVGVRAAGRATVALHKQTVALGKSGFRQIRDGAAKTFRGLALAAGVATAAFGVSALAANQLVDTAAQFEKFQTILETTEGSSAKAKAAMAWVTDFAAKTPYELDQVMQSFVALRSMGLDPTKGLMRDLGDASAAMGVPMLQAVEAMKDAVTGENERLKELGIISSKSGDVIEYSYVTLDGQSKTVKAMKGDAAGIQKAISGIFSEKYGGAMDKLSRTWEGMISNIGDIWLQFKLAIMNAGLFDWMKSKLQLILDTINQLQDSGELDKWAAYIGQNIRFVLEIAWNFAVKVYGILQQLGTYLVAAKDYVGSWERFAAILGALAFAPVLISTAAGIVQIAMGITMLSAALMANPIVLLVMAIVAAAAAIYIYWGPIKEFFIGLWNSIAAGASALWEKLKSLLGFDPLSVLKTAFSWSPVGLIVQNWDGISSAVSAVVQNAFQAVDGVWASIKSVFDWVPTETITAAWAGISDTIGGLIDGATARVANAWNKVKSVFTFSGGDTEANISVTDPATIQAAQRATAALKTDMQAVAAIDTAPAMGKLAALETSAQQVSASVTSSIRQAEAFLNNVSFYNQGVALMDTMAAGIRARAAVVTAEIQKMAQAVRDHLPSSPAKVGPLSDIHKLKFAETIASSIRPAPMVKAMRGAAAATLAAASITGVTVPVSAQPVAGAAVRSEVAARSQSASIAQSQSGGGLHIEYKPTLSLSGDAQSAKADLKKELSAHARHIANLVDEEQRKRSRRKP
ncbi:tape measure protein [Brucella sp. 2280]|uniref:tape measure protein n=1 Tax=Brucella sp. 2280 TaxID=2592625 RepID=UPI001295CA8F|nr:tape measure protein [Brucella sp. 2280]QGA56489.1 hypothetical protein GHC20_05045 [Brucella sp. 2280]